MHKRCISWTKVGTNVVLLNTFIEEVLQRQGIRRLSSDAQYLNIMYPDSLKCIGILKMKSEWGHPGVTMAGEKRRQTFF